MSYRSHWMALKRVSQIVRKVANDPAIKSDVAAAPAAPAPEGPTTIESLGDFMERVSANVVGAYGRADDRARLDRPGHLGIVIEAFERAHKREEDVRVLLSTPPQHGKTALTLYAMVRYLQDHPGHSVAYITYNDDVANQASFHAREIARAAGLKLVTDSLGTWRCDNGSAIHFSSVGSALSGLPDIKLLIIDDPYKGIADAESDAYANKLALWWSGSASPRATPGTSIVIIHTRWVENDLIGIRAKDRRPDGLPIWTYHNLPAINDDGLALWPEGRSLEWLAEKRAELADEFSWWALYMGSPRPRGKSAFKMPPGQFDKLPTGWRPCVGVDLAYSGKARADWNVALSLAEKDDVFYIVDVVRQQNEFGEDESFNDELRRTEKRFSGGAPMIQHGSSMEQYIVKGVRKAGINLRWQRASVDKLARARPVIEAWNKGKVLVPSNKGAVPANYPLGLTTAEALEPVEWLDILLEELRKFTGVGGHDDQVDALSSAYNRLSKRVLFGGGQRLPPTVPMQSGI